MIILDTNICIAYLNGTPAGVVARVSQAVNQQEVVAVPAVVASELFYGAYKSIRVNENLERLRKFLAGVELLDFDLAAARVAGQVKSEIERLGKPTGSFDLLIAATAIRHGATLVTHNTRHFENIPNLKLDDWLR